ncbi:MAG: hypothetical protein IIX02_04335 [Clostridia bacterium]|nr:hypothetical protein [Clostridia bacterium]
MSIELTSEEKKVLKGLVRLELEEDEYALDGLSETPANIKRIKWLRERVATLKGLYEKICK